ncbi:hypothetical protein APSETT445_008543 [Aspergillus pseudonomiae]
MDIFQYKKSNISQKTFLIDPATRERIDIVHLLSGVASSRSEDVAHEFMTTVRAPSYCQAYGSYSDLVNCPTIDVVYIATPHSHHFQNAMLALEAGKHVLCEKSLTVNAAQAKKLFAVAEQKQRFLMEGLWVRFLPVSVEVRRLLQAGAIGTITRVFADNGLGVDPYREFPTGDRMVVKELAGGALLDPQQTDPKYKPQRVPVYAPQATQTTRPSRCAFKATKAKSKSPVGRVVRPGYESSDGDLG